MSDGPKRRILLLTKDLGSDLGPDLGPDFDPHRMLADAGFEVLIPDDHRDFSAQLRRALPDAVVLDMTAQVDGWGLLEQLCGDPWLRSAPVILLSGPEDASSKARGLRAGAADFLTRPFDPEEFVTRLEMRLAERVHAKTRIEGSLEVHSVAELVQTLEASAKSGELRIMHDGLSGNLLLRDGKVVIAECEGHQGAAAVRTMLELEAGRFCFEPGEIVGGKWDGIDLAPLLMDQAWVTDELRARQRHLPSPTSLLEVAGSLSAIPEELAQLPITEAFDYLAGARSSGVAWPALDRQCLDSPQRTRLAVAWLVEQGLVRVSASGGENSPQPRMNILLVEAAAPARRHLAELVARGGWSPIAFKDGLEALEEIWHSTSTVDLIVLDADLPGMDGYKLTSKLRDTASFVDIPIIMLTATVGDMHRQRAVAAGVTEYLVKPYRDEALLQLIRRLAAE